jgi:predicted lysophospholipase L1 biosynthesis ABC-type transport system permease subunit
VAIVNEAFVAKFGLGRGAVGRRVGVWGDRSLGLEIVGVVRNAKYGAVKDDMSPGIYTPHRRDPGTGLLTFYVRAAGDPAPLLRQIPAAVARVDGSVPVQDLKTLPQQIQENVSLDRTVGALSGAFAALATLLAAVGLYGVLAYSVAHRRREIGVRMALGADGRGVRALVLGQVGRLLLAGGAAGVLAALALGRAARSLLFGLTGHDPAVLAGAVGVIALVALAAGYLPARRAARVDPIRALRAE